jgi:serine/threonine-protein kinase
VPDAEASRSDPYLGTTLQGQFHLVEAIGSGAMGTVYRAWQSGMERAVAVKMLRADLLADDELRRRFVREGRAAARLNHPNIVSVHVVGETEAGVPYLVMEHLGGDTLDQLLDAESRLPPERAVSIARQVACALSEAHAAGIVHRDLKPGNVVLLERRGAGELVKIFDFGIAKIADAALLDGEVGRLTRDGAIFGTPHYIAPEQAQGAALDGRADLYSLGILLYRMLSGRLPFDGNAVAVLLAHISRPPPDLAEEAPDVDPALAALVMRCLAKDPARRFASAEDFIEALDGVAGPWRRTSSQAAAPSRAASAPSRAAGAPSRAASAPSRAAGAPSRAASAPSRAASAPSRAASAPSRAASPSLGAEDTEGRGPAPPAASAALRPSSAAEHDVAPRPRGPSPRVVEAVGRVAEPRISTAAIAHVAAGASWTGSWRVDPPAHRATPARHRRRASLAGFALAALCTGAGTGAAAWFGHGEPELAAGEPAREAPSTRRVDVPDQPTRRAIVVSDDGYAVRAQVPQPVLAGQPTELLFDVWDPGGAPLRAPAIPVELASLGAPPVIGAGDGHAGAPLAARPVPDQPGRYRLVAILPAGEAALLLELGGGSIHVHFEVARGLP